MKKTQLKITSVSISVVLYMIKFHVNIHIHLSFDFLRLDNADFENHFANDPIKIGQNTRSPCLIRYKTLGFRLAYQSTPARVLNSI